MGSNLIKEMIGFLRYLGSNLTKNDWIPWLECNQIKDWVPWIKCNQIKDWVPWLECNQRNDGIPWLECNQRNDWITWLECNQRNDWIPWLESNQRNDWLPWLSEGVFPWSTLPHLEPKSSPVRKHKFLSSQSSLSEEHVPNKCKKLKTQLNKEVNSPEYSL
jgi:hypothetical protein